jgi:hypothetical protein
MTHPNKFYVFSASAVDAGADEEESAAEGGSA